MPKKPEPRKGKEAAERFRELTQKVVSVTKAEIDKAEDHGNRERTQTEDATEQDRVNAISFAPHTPIVRQIFESFWLQDVQNRPPSPRKTASRVRSHSDE